ncbi:MAG: hypothetical protein GXP41_06105, partial [Chloroflexi bacterium]|nr:hypothetical protein [Chloroflexota bacterium]
WRAADPTPVANAQSKRPHKSLPSSYPLDGFTISLPVILKQSAGEPTPTATATATTGSLNRPENPQIGLNFIRFDWNESPHYQPSWIFNDFADLGPTASSSRPTCCGTSSSRRTTSGTGRSPTR